MTNTNAIKPLPDHIDWADAILRELDITPDATATCVYHLRNRSGGFLLRYDAEALVQGVRERRAADALRKSQAAPLSRREIIAELGHFVARAERITKDTGMASAFAKDLADLYRRATAVQDGEPQPGVDYPAAVAKSKEPVTLPLELAEDIAGWLDRRKMYPRDHWDKLHTTLRHDIRNSRLGDARVVVTRETADDLASVLQNAAQAKQRKISGDVAYGLHYRLSKYV